MTLQHHSQHHEPEIWANKQRGEGGIEISTDGSESSLTAGTHLKLDFILLMPERLFESDPTPLTQQINRPSDKLLQDRPQKQGNHLENLLCYKKKNKTTKNRKWPEVLFKMNRRRADVGFQKYHFFLFHMKCSHLEYLSNKVFFLNIIIYIFIYVHNIQPFLYLHMYKRR